MTVAPAQHVRQRFARLAAVPGVPLIGVLHVFTRWPVISATVILVMSLTAIFAPLIAPHDPYDHSLLRRNLPPVFSGGTWEYPLGTDVLGRDLLSRMMHGARVSLMVASVGLVSGGLIGITLGLWAGWFGGVIDEIITRIVDIWTGIPFILLALVIALVLGQSIITIGLLLVLVSWSGFVRQVRAQVLIIRTLDYVAAAQINGASTTRILIRHLVPGVLHIILVIATVRVGQLILVESFLSFLGAGIPPPTPSWGNMVSEGRNYLRDAWWIAILPGVAILMITSALTFIGDWLRDFTDPRLRQLR